MKFILFPLLALIALVYLLIVSYKRRWNLKDWNEQSPLAKSSSIKYYIFIIGLIITMIIVIYREVTDFLVHN